MATVVPGGEGTVPEPSQGTGKRRSRIPVRVCPRRADVNSPICKIQRTLEAMNIECGKDGNSQAVVSRPNVSTSGGTSVWWNSGATISWASTPQTMLSTMQSDHCVSSALTPVSTPNFTPLQRPTQSTAVMDTPECTPVIGGLVRRTATQLSLNQDPHVNMVTPGFTPVVSNGVAEQCWTQSGKQAKTSTPCWMMEKTSGVPSLSSSDLILPTPPSSIKRPYPCSVSTQDSMEYIKADSCTQKKVPRRRLPVVGEEPAPPHVPSTSVDTTYTAVPDQDLGVSTLDTSTQDRQDSLHGITKDKKRMLIRHTKLDCATPTPGAGPPTLHTPADSMLSHSPNVLNHGLDLGCTISQDGSTDKSNSLVTKLSHCNNHLQNHYPPKETLTEDRPVGKTLSECFLLCKSTDDRYEGNKVENVLHQPTAERAQDQEDSYIGDAHALYIKSQNSGHLQQNNSKTCSKSHLNVESEEAQCPARPLGSDNCPQGKAVGTEEKVIGTLSGHQQQPLSSRMAQRKPDNKTLGALKDGTAEGKVTFVIGNEDVPSDQSSKGTESGSDSPPPVKVCRLSHSPKPHNGENCSAGTDRYAMHRNPLLACLRNSETFNVLQNSCMESFSSTDGAAFSSLPSHISSIDNSSDDNEGKVSFSNFKQFIGSTTSSPNLTATFADSALGMSVSSVDADFHGEGAHGLSSLSHTVTTSEQQDCIKGGTDMNVTQRETDNDSLQEQLLTDFKENMKLSGRRVHFKLSPEKHPAPPSSPSEPSPGKKVWQLSPRKRKASPRKSKKSPSKLLKLPGKSPQKCSSAHKLRFSPGKLRASPGKGCSPCKLLVSAGRGRGVSPGKLQNPAEVNKVRKSLLDDFGSTKTPATIKRKLFTRDLPRRKALSPKDTEEVREAEGMDDSGLSLSLFVMNDHQPGSKVGWDYVDIIGELTRVCNMPMVVESILAYLDPADLSSVCCVSKDWNQACVNDRKAENCRQKYLRQQRRMAPHGGKENVIKWREAGSVTETTAALATLQIQHITTPRQATPLLSRHDQFAKLARLLPYGHYLTPCIRCRSPAHVHPKHNRAVCQQDSCKFDYCLHCNCAFHGDVPCPMLTPIATPTPKRGRKVRASPVAGSKSSKRRLKRL